MRLKFEFLASFVYVRELLADLLFFLCMLLQESNWKHNQIVNDLYFFIRKFEC